LILAQPTRFPSQKEKDALEKFLISGGRIIAIGTSGAFSLPKESIDFEPIDVSILQKYPGLTPSKITRAAPEITLNTRVFWKEDSSVTALYGTDDKPVVVRYPYGKGEVNWWASATPLNNAGRRETWNSSWHVWEKKNPHMFYGMNIFMGSETKRPNRKLIG
jgi:hypothetical protein